MAESLNNPPSYDDAVRSKQQFDVDPSAAQSHPPNPNQYHPASQAQSYSTTGGFDNVVYKPNVSNNQQQTRQPVPNDTGEESGFTVRGSFADLDIRRLFVRKVFVILGLQLLFTFGCVCLFYFENNVKLYVQGNAGMYYAAYAVFFVMYIVLVCSKTAARKHPWNLVMLIFLTLALSYMVGTITSFYDIEAVLIALGVTVGVCVFVMLFSIQTKFDFTKCAGLLFVLLVVLFAFGFITIFTYSYDWYLQVVYGCLGALVFTLFLAFDTQLVMGGRKYELDPEEHIFASLILYIDIIYIFLFLLSIFGGSSK